MGTWGKAVAAAETLLSAWSHEQEDQVAQIADLSAVFAVHEAMLASPQMTRLGGAENAGYTSKSSIAGYTKHATFC